MKIRFQKKKEKCHLKRQESKREEEADTTSLLFCFLFQLHSTLSIHTN